MHRDSPLRMIRKEVLSHGVQQNSTAELLRIEDLVRWYPTSRLCGVVEEEDSVVDSLHKSWFVQSGPFRTKLGISWRH